MYFVSIRIGFFWFSSGSGQDFFMIQLGNWLFFIFNGFFYLFGIVVYGMYQQCEFVIVIGIDRGGGQFGFCGFGGSFVVVGKGIECDC